VNFQCGSWKHREGVCSLTLGRRRKLGIRQADGATSRGDHSSYCQGAKTRAVALADEEKQKAELESKKPVGEG
jgi:hypothetical protein